MKFCCLMASCVSALSLPVRGAWIEIPITRLYNNCRLCRSPCGERGLKSIIKRQL